MRRKLVIAAAAAGVLVVGGIAARAVLPWGSAAESSTRTKLPPATAEVTRTTLVETKTLTGDDVKQLEENLSGLGYTGFTVDNDFTAGTAVAVRDWQTRLGVAVTGAVEPGQVVFTPGAVRVAAHTARIGATVGRGEGGGATVLSYTVTTPGGKRVNGTITKVGTVATVQDQATKGPPGDGAPVAADARIAVTVDIADQQALGTLEAAPADVDFVSQKREGVLTVPVAALLALPEGGYGVEVVEGSTTRVVAVKTGLFAAGRVEISGGVEEGMKVGVPK